MLARESLELEYNPGPLVKTEMMAKKKISRAEFSHDHFIGSPERTHPEGEMGGEDEEKNETTGTDNELIISQQECD